MAKLRLGILWCLAGLLLVGGLGQLPVQRTQEARVLETARQMLNQPWRHWMVPQLNGQPRLQKPPLAYWMAGAGFSLFGIDDFAGRLPFALCGWMLIAVFFWIAARVIDLRRATIASAMLLGTYLFFRHMRLAETDSPAALAVTVAIGAIWAASSLPPSFDGAGQTKGGNGRTREVAKGRENTPRNQDASSSWRPFGVLRVFAVSASSRRREMSLYHVAAIGMALAALAKGGPIVFPLLFLVLASLAIGKNLVRRFIISGAPVTLLVIALPWYVYILRAVGSGEFRYQMQNNLEGGDHGKPPWAYIPWLATALLPWIAFVMVVLIAAIQWLKDAASLTGHGFREATPELRQAARGMLDPMRYKFFALSISARLLIAWILAIAIPLVITGNKQLHYLLPLMPPVILAAAWLATELADSKTGTSAAKLGGWLIGGTAAAMLGTLIAANVLLNRRHQLQHGDLIWLATVALACLATIGLSFRRRADALQVLILISLGLIKQSVDNLPPRLLGQQNPRAVAAWVSQQFGPSPKAFIGPNVSLPLCYNLREAIPSLHNETEILAAAKAQPGLILIAQDKPGRTPQPPPVPFTSVGTRIVSDEQAFTFYREK